MSAVEGNAAGPGTRFGRRSGAALRIALLLGLAVFYAIAALEHAESINTSKARADQSPYLWNAEVVYHNWKGDAPPTIIGRNRMPLYAGYLALFYQPSMSDADFFVLARKLNVALSIALLAGLSFVFARYLPPILWMNLTLFLAFGYFIFRAGYVQAELLFYSIFFLGFVSCCAMFTPRRPRAAIGLGVLCGVLLALAHLAKAAMLPFLGVFLAAYFGTQAGRALSQRRRGASVREVLTDRAAEVVAGLLVVVAFLSVLAPYLLNSKRVFDHYFYNVNSTFYVWCDSWGQALSITGPPNDEVKWPNLRPRQLPSPSRYWRMHTVSDFASRMIEGFRDMVVRSYQTFWYFKYMAVFLALAAFVAWCQRAAFMRLVQAHAGLASFLVLYAVTYLVLIAFYNPISATGTTRFLQAHLAPAAFVLLRLSNLSPFDRASARLGGTVVTTRHVHLLVSVMLALDIVFTVWPRLMTTYGGF